MEQPTKTFGQMTSAEACEVLNAGAERGRFRPGTVVLTGAGHRLQVGADREFKPLNKSRERERRERQRRRDRPAAE